MRMRLIVTAAALLMPLIAVLSQQRMFGADNAELSARYPTLIVPLGLFFSIWSLIFLIDGIWALRQWQRPMAAALHRVRVALAVGFAATALWMIVFSMQAFWLSFVVMAVALAALLWAVDLLRTLPRAWPDGLIGLHAGWLTLAAFLNLGQVGVAEGWFAFDSSVPGNLALLAGALALGLVVNHRLRGDWAYVAALLWGLAGCAWAQFERANGAMPIAALAVLGGLALIMQTFWHGWQRRPPRPPRPVTARPATLRR